MLNHGSLFQQATSLNFHHLYRSFILWGAHGHFTGLFIVCIFSNEAVFSCNPNFGPADRAARFGENRSNKSSNRIFHLSVVVGWRNTVSKALNLEQVDVKHKRMEHKGLNTVFERVNEECCKYIILWWLCNIYQTSSSSFFTAISKFQVFASRFNTIV